MNKQISDIIVMRREERYRLSSVSSQITMDDQYPLRYSMEITVMGTGNNGW